MKKILLAGCALAIVVATFSLGRWTASEPPGDQPISSFEALREALSNPDRATRIHLFRAAIQELDAESLDGILSLIESADVQLSDNESRLLMRAWARFDPEEAFRYALFSSQDQRRPLASAVIESWTHQDPVAAQGALLGIQNTELERFLQGRFVRAWTRARGGAEVRDYIRKFSDISKRDFLTGVAAKTLVDESTATAIAWADEFISQGEDPFENLVFKKTAGALAKDHPEQAIQWATPHFGKPYAVGAARLIGQGWVESDPDASFAWLASLPHGKERIDAVTAVFGHWRRSEPEKAIPWLEGADPAEALDPAFRVMARVHLEDDPPVAIRWARRIADPGTRERVLVDIGIRWYRKDPEATRRWLATSALPRAARRIIRNQSQ